jgi:hypothetical protein
MINSAKSVICALMLAACSGSGGGSSGEGAAPAGGMDGAGSFALGLAWRSHVFLQQVWRGADPEYLVFNQTGKDIDVLVETTCFRSDTGEPPPPCDPVRLAGPWHVPTASYRSFPASDLASLMQLLTFRLAAGRQFLGVLQPPLAPLQGSLPVISNEGTNGDGGRSTDLQIETDFLVAPGSTFTVTVVVPSGELTLPLHTDPVESVQFFDILAVRSSVGEVMPTGDGFRVQIPEVPPPDFTEDPADGDAVESSAAPALARVDVDVTLPADYAGGPFAVFSAWLCTDGTLPGCQRGTGLSRAIPLR